MRGDRTETALARQSGDLPAERRRASPEVGAASPPCGDGPAGSGGVLPARFVTPRPSPPPRRLPPSSRCLRDLSKNTEPLTRLQTGRAILSRGLKGVPRRPPHPCAVPPRVKLMQSQRAKSHPAKPSDRPTAVFRLNVPNRRLDPGPRAQPRAPAMGRGPKPFRIAHGADRGFGSLDSVGRSGHSTKTRRGAVSPDT